MRDIETVGGSGCVVAVDEPRRDEFPNNFVGVVVHTTKATAPSTSGGCRFLDRNDP